MKAERSKPSGDLIRFGFRIGRLRPGGIIDTTVTSFLDVTPSACAECNRITKLSESESERPMFEQFVICFGSTLIEYAFVHALEDVCSAPRPASTDRRGHRRIRSLLSDLLPDHDGNDRDMPPHLFAAVDQDCSL